MHIGYRLIAWKVCCIGWWFLAGHESWFHHFKLKTKYQSMDWASHQISKTQDDARTIHLPFKVAITVLWDTDWWMQIDFLQRGETIIANLMCRYSRKCKMHFVTSSKQRDPARQQGTSHCTDIYGYWGVWLGSSVSSLHFGLWTWPSSGPRKITQGASTVYRNNVAVQKVACAWLENYEMDISHSSILKFVQLGVETPDNFWNAIVNARKGTINKHTHTFLTQWKINCNLQHWQWAFRWPPLPPLHSWIHSGMEAITYCSKLLGWLQYVANLHFKSGACGTYLTHTLVCR
jgi:hypothetical protein